MAKKGNNNSKTVATPSDVGTKTVSAKTNETLVSIKEAIDELIEKGIVMAKSHKETPDTDSAITSNLGVIVGAVTDPKSEIISKLNSIAVSNVAIAAVLYGYKSVDLKTTLGSFKSKLSKVANEPITQMITDMENEGESVRPITESPIFTSSPQSMDDTNSRLDAIASKMDSIVKGASENAMTGPASKGGSKSKDYTVNIDIKGIEGIDKDSAKALSDILTSIIGVTRLGEDEVDTDSINAKVKNIIGAVNALGEVDFSQLQLDWVKGVDTESIEDAVDIIDSLDTILNTLMSGTVSYVLLGALSEEFSNGIGTVIGLVEAVSGYLNENADNIKTSAQSMENLLMFYTCLDDTLPVIIKTAILINKASKMVDTIIANKDKIIKLIETTNEINAKVGEIETDNIKKTSKESKGFFKSIMETILMGSIILVVAGAAGKLVRKNFKDTMAFIGVLLIFVTAFSLLMVGISALMALVSKIGGEKKVEGTMIDITKLITTGAAVLIIGSLAMKLVDKKSLWDFVWVFGTFVGGILLTFGIASALSRGLLHDAHDIASLILISTVCLLIPAKLIEKDPLLLGNAMLFGGTLILFIGLVSGAFGLASLLIQKGGYRTALGITALIAVSCAAVLIPALVMKNNPGLGGMMWNFVGIMGALILGVSAIVFGLDKLKVGMGAILKGILIMGGICILIAATSASLLLVKKVIDAFDGKWGELLKGIGFLAVAIVLMGGLVTVIGALTLIPGFLPMIGIGGVIVLGIAGVTIAAAAAMLAIRKAMKGIDDISELVGLTQMMFAGFGVIIASIKDIVKDGEMSDIRKINKVLEGINTIAGISTIVADAVLKMTKMKGSDGSQITPQKFINFGQALSDTIGIMVTYISGALGNSMGDIKKLKKGKVKKFIKSLSDIGGIIYNSIWAINQMSRLKFVTGYDAEGKPTGYTDLTNLDDAKKDSMIETLGELISVPLEAVCDAFKTAKVAAGKAKREGLALGEISYGITEILKQYTNIHPAFIRNDFAAKMEKYGSNIGMFINQVLTGAKEGTKGFKKSDLKDYKTSIMLCADIGTSIQSMVEEYTKLEDTDFPKVNATMTKVASFLKKIKGFAIDKDTYKGLINTTNALDKTTLTNVTDTLDNVLYIMKTVESINTVYDRLGDKEVNIKMPKFTNIISDDAEITRLEREVAATKEFVKTLEHINVNKVTSINDLAESMGRIAENFDIENLVTLINDKLTGTLAGISEQLDKSSSIEKYRVDSVGKYIKDIKDIVSTKIKVAVSAEGSGYDDFDTYNAQDAPKNGGNANGSTSASAASGGTLSISAGQNNETPTEGGYSKNLAEDYGESLWNGPVVQSDVTAFANANPQPQGPYTA